MNEVYRDVERHIPHLRRYARAMTQDPVTADDLVQDSLVRALTKCQLYKPGTNLRAWLFTILHNQYVSGLRRRNRAGVSVDPDEAAPALATQPNQESGLVVKTVESALRSLPEDQRSLIVSVALDGESYDQVAKTHDLALGTVKSRISRGRAQLRLVLEGRTGRKEPPPREGRCPANANHKALAA